MLYNGNKQKWTNMDKNKQIQYKIKEYLMQHYAKKTINIGYF